MSNNHLHRVPCDLRGRLTLAVGVYIILQVDRTYYYVIRQVVPILVQCGQLWRGYSTQHGTRERDIPETFLAAGFSTYVLLVDTVPRLLGYLLPSIIERLRSIVVGPTQYQILEIT